MIRNAIPFFIIYVLLNQSDGTTAKMTYLNVSQSAVDKLLAEGRASTGLTYRVVTEKEFRDVSSPSINFPVPDSAKQQAISDAKNTGKTPEERIDALIKAIDLK